MNTWRIWAYTLSIATLWLILRFAIGYYHDYDYLESRSWGILLNLIFIVVLFFLVLYKTYSKEPQIRGYFDDFKLCLKSGIAYSVAITIAIGIYYTCSNDMNIKRVADYKYQTESLDTPEKVAIIKASIKKYENMTKEEIHQSLISDTNDNTSVKRAMLLCIACLIFCSLIYSLIVPFVFRTVMLKELS
jgi:hypothetical protein